MAESNDRQGAVELAKDTFASLDAMMAAYAAEAVRIAGKEFHELLDFTPASVGGLERILNRLSPAPGPLGKVDGEQLTMLWGSYFGELLRREHGGEWIMSLYPGAAGAVSDGAAAPGEFAVPTIEFNGSRLYPLLKVHRRLALGAGEDLQAFYAMVAARLSVQRGSSSSAPSSAPSSDPRPAS